MTWLEFRCRHRHSADFTLDVELKLDAPVAALYGPSGSGKTSVLHILAGLHRPDEGYIRVRDRVLLDTSRRIDVPIDRRRVGVVFQDRLLFPHMSVRDNIDYGRRRRPGNVDPDAVIATLEIGPLLERFPRELSGGERQRIAVARTLLSSPEILLLDEPLAALDDDRRAKILTYLDRVLAEFSIPTLLVSHSPLEIRRLAQSVHCIRDGRIVAIGTPDEVLSPSSEGLHNGRMTNLLHVADIKSGDDGWLGKVGGSIVQLPSPPPESAATFVHFHANDVVLSRQDVVGVSARNHFPGTVRQIVNSSGRVFVAVDIGQIVWAEITPQSVRDLDLAVGKEIVCLLKTVSIHWVE